MIDRFIKLMIAVFFFVFIGNTVIVSGEWHDWGSDIPPVNPDSAAVQDGRTSTGHWNAGDGNDGDALNLAFACNASVRTGLKITDTIKAVYIGVVAWGSTNQGYITNYITAINDQSPSNISNHLPVGYTTITTEIGGDSIVWGTGWATILSNFEAMDVVCAFAVTSGAYNLYVDYIYLRIVINTPNGIVIKIVNANWSGATGDILFSNTDSLSFVDGRFSPAQWNAGNGGLTAILHTVSNINAGIDPASMIDSVLFDFYGYETGTLSKDIFISVVEINGRSMGDEGDGVGEGISWLPKTDGMLTLGGHDRWNNCPDCFNCLCAPWVGVNPPPVADLNNANIEIQMTYGGDDDARAHIDAIMIRIVSHTVFSDFQVIRHMRVISG